MLRAILEFVLAALEPHPHHRCHDGYHGAMHPAGDRAGEARVRRWRRRRRLEAVRRLAEQRRQDEDEGPEPLVLEPLPPVPEDAIAHMRPLVGLCMHVALADGVANADERMLMADWAIADSGLSGERSLQLKELFEQEPPPLTELVAAVRADLPEIEPVEIMSLLAAVAAADGRRDDRELAALRHAAVLLGVPERDWPADARALLDD